MNRHQSVLRRRANSVILVISCVAGLMVVSNGVAQNRIPASVIASHQLDANDGKHPIHDRVGGDLVARPGVYPYAYGPTLLFDPRDQLFKMWAGVGWNGDTISYKQAKSLSELDQQPWEIALEPRRAEPVADQDHCCDPCVIAAEGGYYLYYTGAGKSDRWPNGQGYVMVAFSKDGRKFDRLNEGVPVVDMGKAYKPVIGYGVGQPAVTLGPDGWYYMLYTYSADNQYADEQTNYLGVIRSQKPDFIQHEQVTRLSRHVYGCSNDLVYDPENNTFVMVVNESHPARGVQVRFVSCSTDFKVIEDCHILTKDLPDNVLGEGLGILTDPQRRLLHSKDAPGTVTISGASYRERDNQPSHIAGPTYAITWKLKMARQTAESRDTMPDTWTAEDALGRTLPMSAEVGTPKPNRTVGIFYFNWHAAFGNTKVHDIAKILTANQSAPAWGPVGAPHYWSEPRFGYYRPDDPWVIRKHVQMLTDAGVDMLILDATNAFTYDAEREALCTVLEQMKAEGRRVPSIAMFPYANHLPVVQHLWETFYQPGKHRDLWFQWKGKPLLLTPTDGLSEEVKSFFTIRTSWAWTRGHAWFGDGKDKWPWLDFAPQTPGWHDAPDKAECVPVGVSQHITSNIGRSFHGSRQPMPDECRPGEGLYFDEQWRHALPHNPEFIFITGWNEWVAQRFLSDGTMTFQGRVLPAGETFFVDLYDQEFSRDIEPMRGGFGDNYYWQMVANIRRYKGTRPVPVASPSKTIAIPGDFAQWADVKPVYLDDLHDTTHRDHDGVPGAGRYTNKTGRNDLDTAHVAHDATHLYFHITTREPLTPTTDADWMGLLLDTDQNAKTGHHGHDIRINQTRSAADKASAERWNGKSWEPIGTATIQVGTKDLHLAIERATLGLSTDKPLRFDFKWTDNIPSDADPIDYLDHGDTAPNARFHYRVTAAAE